MITHNDVVRLLALAASADQRTVAPEDVQLWHLVARRERWTADAAAAAMVEYHASGAARPRITPAAISDRLRSLRHAAAVSFEAPRIPDDLANADYPAWLRARLAEHVDGVLARWAADGVEPAQALPALPSAVRRPEQLAALAPARVRRAITAGVGRLLGRRVVLNPITRDRARAELDRVRAAQATADPS